ncbi:MAG: hypothetical protein ACOCZ9_03495 [Spirochaetota bacterium]
MVDINSYMKAILLAGVLLIQVMFPLGADESLTVQNETNDPVRFAIVPAERVPQLPVSGSLLEEFVEELVEDFTDSSRILAPRGVSHLPRPSFSDPILLGYIRREEQESYPVVRRRIEGQQDFVWIDDDALVSGEDSARLRIPAELSPARDAPVAVDNRYSDWIDVPDLAAFRHDFRPEHFTRITAGSTSRAEIADSLLWRRGGTSLERVKALVWEDAVYLMSSVLTPMSQDYSLLLRAFENRTEDSRNEFTVEIPAGDIAGPVLVWVPDRQQPYVAGEFARSRFLLEARIDPDMIPANVLNTDPEALSIDIVSSLADAGVREEFHHTSVVFRNIPRVHSP